MHKNLTCIVCPTGCRLNIDSSSEGYIIRGYQCKKGLAYANQELTHPKRDLSSTILVTNREHTMVPVRVDGRIDKASFQEIMQAIHQTKIEAPIGYHAVIIKNVCNTGVNVIATKAIL